MDKENRNNEYYTGADGTDSGSDLFEMLEVNLEEFDSEHFREFFTYAGEDYQEEFGAEIEDAVEQGRVRERKRKKSFFSAFFYLIGQRIKSRRIRRLDDDVPGEDEIEEPVNIPKIAAGYSRPLGSMLLRSRAAFVICAVMIYLTLSFGFTGHAAVVGENGSLLVSVLMIMQLVTVLLCLEVPMTGIFSAVKLMPGAETLITASFIFTFTDSAFKLLTGDLSRGLPFNALSALSVTFGLRGMLYYNSGMRDSLRVLSKVKTPWGLAADRESVENRIILRRTPFSTEGFYKNLMGRDICEHVYSYAAPILLAAALVLAVLATASNRMIGDFLHALGALMAAAASFSCMSAYSMPFRMTASLLRKEGCAVAGWTGADKLFDIDGILITDKDLFPKGTQTVAGVRLVGNMSRYKAAEYAGSLAAVSGSSLAEPFRALMDEEDASAVDVAEFNCYDSGGIGGVIRGETVMLGTGSFMTAKGVRLPEDVPSGRVIYLSVNSRIAAVFAIKYKASEKVKKCLADLKKTKLTLLFALKDFNLEPRMLEKKFGIPLAGAEYIPLEDCYRVSREEAETGDAVGIMSRSGFVPMAKAAACAAKLRQAALISTFVSVLSSAALMFILFYMASKGPIYSVTAWGTGVFMLASHLITVLLANLTRR